MRRPLRLNTRFRPDEWLEARCRGSARAGDVILHAPSFAFQSPGGGENQLVQSGRHLEELGIPIRLFSAWTDRLEAARLLHLFGMSREGLELARRGEGPEDPGGSLADLLVRAACHGGARARCDPESRAA